MAFRPTPSPSTLLVLTLLVLLGCGATTTTVDAFVAPSSGGGFASSGVSDGAAAARAAARPRPRSRAAATVAALAKKSSGDFEDDFVDMQVSKTAAIKGGDAAEGVKPPAHADADEHLSHQREVFDSMSSFFSSDDATPAEVVPVMQYLATKIIEDITDAADEGVGRRNSRTIARAQAAAKREGTDLDRAAVEGDLDSAKDEYDLLDVACGTGALWPFLMEAADARGVALNIRGVDLSPGMVEGAAKFACKVLGENDEKNRGDGRHVIKVQCGDFVEVVRGDEEAVAAGAGEEEAVESKFVGKFDAVVMNACFGNFFDTGAALDAAAATLSADGVVCITHPLGAAFVDKLRDEDPSTVPHSLPTSAGFSDLCLTRPLEMTSFAEKARVADGDFLPVYFAGARRRPSRALEKVLRFRGPVAKGYGRGGKKLGFPTANLPASLFADALADVDAGVYLGWAVVEGDEGQKGRNVPHKVVVNVGYSPTFAGSENPEKIVEAHLIIDDDSNDTPGDFYDETMRLSLCGRLRPEKKFPSFPALVEQITTDRDDAREALDGMPYAFFGTEEPFVSEAGEGEWVGGDGGDGVASWEFRSLRDALMGTD